MAKRTFENILSSIAEATVWFPRRKGQGVLMEGGMILTAAHCLNYTLNQASGLRLAGGHDVLFDFETAQGEKLKCEPLAIEVCADIAVLAVPDNQMFFEESEAYEEWCEKTKPVSLWRKRMSFPAEFPIHIRSHKKTWITGRAKVYREFQSTLWIRSDENIEGGTSGGPIINDAGEIVGLVSIAGGGRGETKEGPCSCPRWALPTWILRKIYGMGKEA